jgi:hypothetical protein
MVPPTDMPHQRFILGYLAGVPPGVPGVPGVPYSGGDLSTLVLLPISTPPGAPVARRVGGCPLHRPPLWSTP